MKITEHIKEWFRSLPAYDGGGFDRRNSGWTPVDGTGEAINQMSRDLIRSRARDLERNSDNVCAIIDAFERNVVGAGIRLQSKVLAGELEDEILNSRIETLWDEWCNFQNCDITGQFCFTEMQKMAVRRRLVDGGLIFIFCPSHGKIPFQLQMKEVSELDIGILEHGKNKVVAGIEVDDYGRALAYHFKEYDTFGWNGKSIRVDAKNVVFICNKTRPSDIREISILAKILSRLRDLNQFMEAVAVKERILACLAVFVKRVAKGSGIGRQDTQTKNSGAKKLSPGMIEELDPGDSVDVVNPSGQASNANEFVTLQLRSIGAALGLSYEATSRDMGKSNYSSARQSLIDDFKTYRIWQNYLIEHLCKPVYERFLECAVLSGQLEIPDFFTNEQKYLRCTFIPAGMMWIDPLKEVRANEFALKSCQTTLEEICASTGKDYRDVLRQRSKEKDLMHEYGLEDIINGNAATGNGILPKKS